MSRGGLASPRSSVPKNQRQRHGGTRAGRPLAHLAVLAVAFVVTLVGLASSLLGVSGQEPSPRTTQDALALASTQTPESRPVSTATALINTPVVATPGASTASSHAVAAPSATPKAEATQCERHESGLYCVYTVALGDTLSAIASRFGLVGSGELSPADLLAESNQPAVAEANSIAPGLKLRIPTEVAIVHTVLVPETTSSVGERYGVDPVAIQAFASNKVDPSGQLSPGQEILVPKPLFVSDPAPPADVIPLSDPEEDSAQALADVDVDLDTEAVAEQEEARIPANNQSAPTQGAGSEPEENLEEEQNEGESEEQEQPDEETATAVAESNVEPTAEPAPEAAVVSSGFKAGDKVLVATDNGDCLRVREGPGLQHPKIDCIKNGSYLTLGAGPTDADGYQWWQLEGRKGAVAGEFLRAEGLRPGDRVVVATDNGECLRLREGPGLSMPRTACIRNGSLLTLGASPVEADGHQWWQIEGRTGVVSGTYLRYEEPKRTSVAGFIWPATGPITSHMGASHPKGIDIGFRHDPNQPVVATAAGKVTFVGGDPCCSYGYYVTVDHGGGWSSLYAHFSAFAPGIKVGDQVEQGQLLGYGGTTGFSTGYHLHFELIYNGAHMNPLNYLP